MQDFFERYADTQTPVIISDYAQCFENMTVQVIRRVCGGKNTVLAQRANQDSGISLKWTNVGQLN